jgi:HAD superfamily hydrolase (TIGR01509 family)
VFFDMGGTLVGGPQGEDPWYPVVMQRVAEEFGQCPWAEELYRTDLWQRSSEPYRQETNRWISEWLSEHDQALSDAQVERLRRAFAAPLPSVFTLKPGAAEALRWCKAHGLSVAVLTNTMTRADDDIARDWERFGLAATIDEVVSSYSTGWAKPHAAIFERALASSRSSPSEAVMIGDEYLADVVGAKRAGMRAIWISPKRIEQSEFVERPDAIVASLLELPTELDRWCSERA